MASLHLAFMTCGFSRESQRLQGILCALQIDHSQVNLLVIYRESLPLSLPQKIADLPKSQPSRDWLRDWLPWVLTTAVAFVLFYQLGGAALFEPDEGCNAELYLLLGLFYPTILAHQIRDQFTGMTYLLWFYSTGSLLALGFVATRIVNKARARQDVIYLVHAFGLCLFLVFVTRMTVSISPDKLQDPLTPWGKAVFNPHELRELWNRGKLPLLVIV